MESPPRRGGVSGPICPRGRPRYRNRCRLCRHSDRRHPGSSRISPYGSPSGVPRFSRLSARPCLLLRVPGRVPHRASSFPEAPAPPPGFAEVTPLRLPGARPGRRRIPGPGSRPSPIVPAPLPAASGVPIAFAVWSTEAIPAAASPGGPGALAPGDPLPGCPPGVARSFRAGTGRSSVPFAAGLFLPRSASCALLPLEGACSVPVPLHGSLSGRRSSRATRPHCSLPAARRRSRAKAGVPTRKAGSRNG